MKAYQKAYSTRELARLWGCSSQNIRRMIARGDLKAFRAGKHIIRIGEDAIEEYLCRANMGKQLVTIPPSPETPNEWDEVL